MPFKSRQQRKWMWATDPGMAKKWQAHTPKDVDLPKKVHEEGEPEENFVPSMAEVFARS